MMPKDEDPEATTFPEKCSPVHHPKTASHNTSHTTDLTSTTNTTTQIISIACTSTERTVHTPAPTESSINVAGIYLHGSLSIVVSIDRPKSCGSESGRYVEVLSSGGTLEHSWLATLRVSI